VTMGYGLEVEVGISLALYIETTGATVLYREIQGERLLVIATQNGFALNDAYDLGALGALATNQQTVQAIYNLDTKILELESLYEYYGFVFDAQVTIVLTENGMVHALLAWEPPEILKMDTSVHMEGSITWQGDMSFDADTTVAFPFSGFELASASFHLDRESMTLDAILELPEFGSATVTGDIHADGTFSLVGEVAAGTPGFTLAGYELSGTASIVFDNIETHGIALDASLAIPGTIVEMAGRITATTNPDRPISYDIKGFGDFAYNGYTMATTMVRLHDGQLTLSGTFKSPVAHIAFSGHLTPAGRFTLTSSGTLSFSHGFNLLGADLTLSNEPGNEGLRGNATLTLANRSFNAAVAINPDGTISASGELAIGGLTFVIDDLTISPLGVVSGGVSATLSVSRSVEKWGFTFGLDIDAWLEVSASGWMTGHWGATVDLPSPLSDISTSGTFNLSTGTFTVSVGYPCVKTCYSYGVPHPCNSTCHGTISVGL